MKILCFSSGLTAGKMAKDVSGPLPAEGAFTTCAQGLWPWALGPGAACSAVLAGSHSDVTVHGYSAAFSDGNRQWFASNFWLFLFLKTMQVTDVCCWLYICILWKLENRIADIQTTLIPISREPNLPSLRYWFLVFTGLKTISVTQYKNGLGDTVLSPLKIITFYKHLRHYWYDSSRSCIQLRFQFQLTIP